MLPAAPHAPTVHDMRTVMRAPAATVMGTVMGTGGAPLDGRDGGTNGRDDFRQGWARGVHLLARTVDVRLPGKGNSNFHGARPVHLIITMITWIRSSRLSTTNSFSLHLLAGRARDAARQPLEQQPAPHRSHHHLHVAPLLLFLLPATSPQSGSKLPLSTPLICSGGRRNPATCGTNQGSRQRGFASIKRSKVAGGKMRVKLFICKAT